MLLQTAAGETFEYRKNNDVYWNIIKIYKQVVSKVL